ncbi:hypothetical protein [Streptomyces sp. NPDC054837]
MPPSTSESELEAARAVEFVTGQRVEPYDKCVECGDFHDKNTPMNGRYDWQLGETGALEVTSVTSRAAERNERDWDPYIPAHPAPALHAYWHLIVDSSAKAKAPRGKKAARGSKEFHEAVGPALAELERRGVSELSAGTDCFSSPFHDPACRYGALRRAGVASAWAASGSDGAGSISVGVLFGFDGMPAFDEEDERKKRQAQEKKQRAKEGKASASQPSEADSSRLGPVHWSFDPGFIAQLESRRADDVQREVELLRGLFAGRRSESEIAERAREAVDEKIALARTMTWREQLPSLPGPRTADMGTDLVDLLEVEFSLHEDLAAKLLRAHPSRSKHEVFFWLTWMRSSAWHRLTRYGLFPDRAPELPEGVTGVWVGCLTDRTQVLHWGAEAGWTRHSLEGALPTSFCRQ